MQRQYYRPAYCKSIPPPPKCSHTPPFVIRPAYTPECKQIPPPPSKLFDPPKYKSTIPPPPSKLFDPPKYKSTIPPPPKCSYTPECVKIPIPSPIASRRHYLLDNQILQTEYILELLQNKNKGNFSLLAALDITDKLNEIIDILEKN